MTVHLAEAPSAASSFDTDAARWEAVQRRDPAADGLFVTCVKSTGIYCRPTCSARLPRRENVLFHPTPAAAERAGFRPCKRCRPADPDAGARHARAVAEACRHIEAAEEPPNLESLAAAAGMSRFHFHRTFKRLTGVTPKAYAAACRAERLRAALPAAGTVTAAIYDAGYNAGSRFYEESAAQLGMAPRAYRAGGTGATIRFAVGPCALGHVLVAATERGITAIQLGDDPQRLLDDFQDRFRHAALVGADADFERMVAAVVAYVEEPAQTLDLPLDVRGTAFQRRVWEALRRIPLGRTATYTEIAAAIGAPRAVRAVAHACASNQAALAIPCHRVVRLDGDLAGYRWGVERKRALLAREAECERKDRDASAPSQT